MSPDGAALLATNQRFYDALWSDAALVPPARFATWPLVRSLAAAAPMRLEAGAGLRPRLPVEGTWFADISLPALSGLRAAGGRAVAATVGALPFPDATFGLLAALDVVEHLDDDAGALRELARVAAPGATLLLSLPLHPEAWSGFDALVGHRRRYDPVALVPLLARAGFTVDASAAAGMRPRSSRLAVLGLWFLRHHRRTAMRWYNRVFMPLGLRFARPLALHPGLADMAGWGGALLVCRRTGEPRERGRLATAHEREACTWPGC